MSFKDVSSDFPIFQIFACIIVMFWTATIEKEIKDAIAEERRRCAAWAHAYEQDDDPAVSAGDTAYRIRRWIEDGTPEPR